MFYLMSLTSNIGPASSLAILDLLAGIIKIA